MVGARPAGVLAERVGVLRAAVSHARSAGAGRREDAGGAVVRGGAVQLCAAGVPPRAACPPGWLSCHREPKREGPAARDLLARVASAGVLARAAPEGPGP